MKGLSQRMSRIMEELGSLQRDLHQVLMDSAADEEQGELRGPNLDLEAVRDFKSTVDQTRHFLWFFMQTFSQNSEEGERTLQVLRQMTKSSHVLGPRSPLTFLEKLNALTEYALVHAREDKATN